MKMSARQAKYAGASALVVAVAAYLYVKRREAISATLAAAPTVFASDSYSLPSTDFPPGTEVTWFQGQITPRALPSGAGSTTGSGNYIPLFGFLATGGYGIGSPDAFA